MEFLNNYAAFLEEKLGNYSFPKHPENLYQPLSYFLTLGGKRMRPIACLMGAKLFGSTNEKAVSAALAVELFHNFTLIHDDIMDQAPLRRGKQTVHEKWNTNIAILSGDVLFVKAFQLLEAYNAHQLKSLLTLFNKTAIEVCEGQQMDMDFESRKEVREAEYIEMIRLKTSVLLGCSLEMGAIVANTTPENQQLIYDFGVNLGIAFQIQDDILDLLGDPEKVGKQVGGDVMANKKTLLSIETKLLANSEQLEQLSKLENEIDLEKKVEQTKAIVHAVQADKKCREHIDFYYQKAINSLEKINCQGSKKELFQLSQFLIERDY